MLCYYSARWSSFSQSPGARRRLHVLAQPLLGSSFAALTAGSPLPKPWKRHTPLSLHQDPETARAQDHEHKEGGREQKKNPAHRKCTASLIQTSDTEACVRIKNVPSAHIRQFADCFRFCVCVLLFCCHFNSVSAGMRRQECVFTDKENVQI